jgi:polyphosphate kinase
VSVSVEQLEPSPHTGRDLSWLDFDRRVFELASDPRRPPAERLKLFAIVASNLDEFFAVRVARLEAHDDAKSRSLRAQIRERVLELQHAQDELWREDLQPSLHSAGLRILVGTDGWDRPGGADAYHRTIEPMVRMTRSGSPGALPDIDSGRVAVVAGTRDDHARPGLALALVPRGTRFVCVGGDWLFVDDGVARHAASLLSGRPVEAVAAFRMTRNAELEPAARDDEQAASLEQRLAGRPFGDVVRVEVAAAAPEWLVDLLVAQLGVRADQVYRPSAPVGLGDLRYLVGSMPADAAETDWTPTVPPAFVVKSPESLFRRIRTRERLVHHPYESFEHTVQAFAEASRDTAVTSLHATVYRTSRPSGTLAALVDTAAEGKRAECLVELRARFDEPSNLEWSRTLASAGVTVVHGPRAQKVHAKLMMITRDEPDGVRRYVHVGTGNYHASNAFSYEDLSLFSADEGLVADVDQLFSVLASGERPGPFRRLLVGPWYLRDGLMAELERVTDAARAGTEARIRIKVNALGDDAVVAALHDAAKAGADVELIVRGVCTLVPVAGGRITVRSVLGRFLEHSRIFSFEAGDERRMWIGSADLLTRNLDARVETLAPVENRGLQLRLLRIFDTLLADTRDAWELDHTGAWSRVASLEAGTTGSAQEAFMARAAPRSRG